MTPESCHSEVQVVGCDIAAYRMMTGMPEVTLPHMQSRQAAVSKQRSENGHLQSTWLFLSVHVRVCVYIYGKITVAQQRSPTTHKIQTSKETKSVRVKIQFPHHPYFNFQYHSQRQQLFQCLPCFYRYCVKTPLPVYSFCFQSQTLYFRQLYI